MQNLPNLSTRREALSHSEQGHRYSSEDRSDIEWG